MTTLTQLVTHAARLWNTQPHLIQSRSRHPQAVAARHAVAWTAHIHLNLTPQQIANHLNVHRTTILRAEPDLNDPRLRDLEDTCHP